MDRSKFMQKAAYLGMLFLMITCFIAGVQARDFVKIKPYELLNKRFADLRSLVTADNMIDFTCVAPAYRIEKKKDGVIFQLKGYDTTYIPGAPMIPYVEYEFALPGDVDPATIRINYKITQSEEVPGKHNIKSALPFRTWDYDEKGNREMVEDWGPSTNIRDMKDSRIYKSAAPYPEHPVTLESQQQMRKWKYVKVRFYPLRYYPQTGNIVYIKAVKAVIRFDRKKTDLMVMPVKKTYQPVIVHKDLGKKLITRKPVQITSDRVMDKEASQRFKNFKSVIDLKWYETGEPSAPGDAIADYVIITTNAIEGSSTVLSDFVNHKISFGHTVRVVTEDDYGVLTGQAPDGTAEKIRQWLIDNYIPLGVKWVLLIGDPDPDDNLDPADTVGDVPMKMGWANRYSYRCHEYPTDYFYSELTGNWDLDGDGFYGESISITNPSSPDPSIDPETFSVRWTGQIEAAVNGTCYFSIYSDEGVRLTVDGTIVVDDWTPHLPNTSNGNIALTAGMHDIVIEYYDLSDDGMLIVRWIPPGETNYVTMKDTGTYYLSGGSYVQGGLSGEYFNNEDLTSSQLTRIDNMMSFYWGTGDNGPGGVEWTPEVYVGRIPVYDADYTALDDILQKMIDYESETVIPDWRRRILLPMKPSDASTPGYEVGEHIKDNACIPAGLGYHRIYEEDYGLTPAPETTPCSVANVLAEWQNGYGMTTWFTHGWWNSASGVFNSASCSSLDDSRPSITFQASCHNGRPEYNDNLGYALLKEGAVATVSAARVSWYAIGIFPDVALSWGFNQSFATSYSRFMLGGLTTGQSFHAVKDGNNHWKNNMTYNLYGDPSMSLFRPYEVPEVDMIPVLDRSGSMQGVSSSGSSDSKINVLKEAANQFVDMMTGDEGHQFGLVKFNENAETIHDLQPFTEAGKGAIHTLINGISPSGLTSIGDGLYKAWKQFDTNGMAGNRRVVLLVTDGRENRTLWIADAKPYLLNGNVKVFPLGLGQGAFIDEAKLIDLAESTGGDYRITDDDLVFRKYFVEILCEATDWNVVTDPIVSLLNNQQSSVPVYVSSADSEMIFTVYWSDHDNAVTFTLKAPDGKTYSPSHSGYKGSARYAIYKIKPATNQRGKWYMNMKGKNLSGSDKVRFSASAFSKSGTQMTVELENGIIHTGDRNLIAVRLMHHGKPVQGAKVNAYLDTPKTGYGNLIRYNPVDMKKAVTVKAAIKKDMSPLEQKTELIKTRLKGKFNERLMNTYTLYDDGTHGDRVKDNGVYSVTVMNTRVPGSYTARVKAEFMIGNKTATREWTKTFTTKVAIDARYSPVQIKAVKVSRSKKTYRMIVTPKDRFGNFMGPGQKVTMKGSDGKTYTFKDNLDGTYSLDHTVKSKVFKKEPDVNVSINGKTFTQFTLK